MGFCSGDDEVDWRFSVSMDRPFRLALVSIRVRVRGMRGREWAWTAWMGRGWADDKSGGRGQRRGPQERGLWTWPVVVDDEGEGG